MPAIQTQSAFFLALEEKKKQMTKEISNMSEQLDMILAKSKNASASVNQVPASCQKPTRDLTEVIEEITLPSFEPVCPFSMVQSHSGEQEEVDPEAEAEEVATVLPVKVAMAVKKTERKVMILSPIQEEGVTAS